MDQRKIEPPALEKLWPNRTHESNWLKDLLCGLGLHRWYAVQFSPLISGKGSSLLPMVFEDQRWKSLCSFSFEGLR